MSLQLKRPNSTGLKVSGHPGGAGGGRGDPKLNLSRGTSPGLCGVGGTEIGVPWVGLWGITARGCVGWGGDTGGSLHPLLCSHREVQHLRDAEGAECQKHHHRGAGQPACLGAGLHVVSAPTPIGTPTHCSLYPVGTSWSPHPTAPCITPIKTWDPPTPLLPASPGSPNPCCCPP